MSKLAERTDIPVLDGGWINLTEAAAMLDVSRSYIYKLADKPGALTTLRRVGQQNSFVVNVSELETLRAAQAERPEKKAPEPAAEKADKAEALSLDALLAEMP